MVSGLGYFELNTANGQHFDVHFNAAQARAGDQLDLSHQSGQCA